MSPPRKNPERHTPGYVRRHRRLTSQDGKSFAAAPADNKITDRKHGRGPQKPTPRRARRGPREHRGAVTAAQNRGNHPVRRARNPCKSRKYGRKASGSRQERTGGRKKGQKDPSGGPPASQRHENHVFFIGSGDPRKVAKEPLGGFKPAQHRKNHVFLTGSTRKWPFYK